MNKDKFKKINIYSLIAGAVLGLITIIPYIQIASFLIMCLITSILIIIYMERKNEIGQLTIKGAGLIGGYIGFIGLVGFLVTFLPAAAILGAIVELVSPNNIYFSGIKFLIQIWWILLLMGGLITALFNAFALISYIYIKDTFSIIEGKKEIKANFIPRSKDGV